MVDHGSTENDMNRIIEHIDYAELYKVLNEALAGLALLFVYRFSICTFLGGMTGRPIHNIEDAICTRPTLSITTAAVPRPATSSQIS